MIRHGTTDSSSGRGRILVAAFLSMALLACGAAIRPPCWWRITDTRLPAAGEVPFTERDPLLREPQSANDVPGPGSVHFVVRKTADHKPAIYLEDRRSGRSQLLLARASGPRVSPDGRYLACIVWRSPQRPWTLVILDLQSRRQTQPALDGCASPYVWSPDAKWIAVMVTPCQTPQSRLALVAMPSGRVRWIDSLGVFSDYEFGWSPDSRHLAVVRPTAVDASTEDPTATELWIFSDGGRHRCPVTTPFGYVHHDPRWITNSAIQIDRVRRTGGQERVVLQLSEGAGP